MDEHLAARKLDEQADALNLDAADIADIFAASDAVSQYRLRMTLSDPSVPAEVRGHVVRQLFSERLSPNATELLALTVELASEPAQLEAGIERQGIRALFMLSGAVEEVQDEVFYFARILQSDPDLQTMLTDRLIEVEQRQQFVAELLADRASPAAIQLVQRAVKRRGRTLVKTLDQYVEIAAQIARETVAHVTVAHPLTQTQRAVLNEQLIRIYGVGIDIQTEVDPNVLGGVRIQVGDDLIDGSILNKLNEARRLIG